MAARKLVLVFVHGWSVTDTHTYGGLPNRLQNAAPGFNLDIQIEEIFLGRYISFHDEVRLCDISRAFNTAVAEQLSHVTKNDGRFICITHSTGGPVIRDWWYRYYSQDEEVGICPMSHLIMLAPANFGSALAQLGKSRISRLKSWFEGVEPGQGVLDWLELGSSEACELNRAWIESDGTQVGENGIFPFVLIGQSIDRAFYDHLNSYTGELGSDGVVRTAAANLNSTYVRLRQEKPGNNGDKVEATELVVESMIRAPKTATRIISGKSHSGETRGIMRSVDSSLDDEKSHELVTAIFECLKIEDIDEYNKLCDAFYAETEAVQVKELKEKDTHIFREDTYFIHDKYSMIIFRVQDDEGYPVKDFDLILTAGPGSDPNHLPRGFFVDRQRNQRNSEVITYYFNHDMMKGTKEVRDGKEIIRPASKGAKMLGFKVNARPNEGFVKYLPCEIEAAQNMLEQAMHRNSTTIIDIVLHRLVSKQVFELEKAGPDTEPRSFDDTKPEEFIT
jgi:hypothetical protein